MAWNNGQPVYPEYWGAKGDGSTLDTIAFQNTVSALPSTGGTIIIGPNKNFNLGTITIATNGITIQGANRTTSSITQNTLGGAVLNVSSAVTDFTLDSINMVRAGPGAVNGGQSSNEGILLNSGVTRAKITNSNFSKLAYWAVRAVTCNDCWVQNNEWTNSWGGLVLWQGGNQLHTDFNTVHDPPNNNAFQAPIQIDSTQGGGGVASNAEFTQNIFYNLVNGESETLHACNHCIITGSIANNVDFGIGVTPLQAGDTVNDVTVTGTVMIGTSTNAGQGSSNCVGINVSGLAAQLATHVAITGNIIENANVIFNNDSCGPLGINNADDVVVTGNIFRNSHGSGITLSSNNLTRRVYILNNAINDMVNSSGAGNRGIYVPTGSGITGLIQGNTFDLNTGTSTCVRADVSVPGLLLGQNNCPRFVNGIYTGLQNFGIAPSLANVKGICTGTSTSSSTLAVRITGVSTAGSAIPTTCTSTTLDAGLPMNGFRTISGLLVTATHAGVNASSGVVTVLRNGGATPFTCTIGTGTSCQSTTTVAVNDGDLISAQFTTQAAEVLAGVNVTILYQ